MGGPTLFLASPSSGSSARIRWAQLLTRIFQVLPLLCASCGGDMRRVDGRMAASTEPGLGARPRMDVLGDPELTLGS